MTLVAALELSVLFVCIWGFIAIMLTGQFGIPVVLFCVLSLLGGYYFRKKGWKPGAIAANLSAILVFGVAVGIFATTFNLLSATVHLFLFLQVTKYITRRTTAENRWCYLISLFNIIGASVITTTFTFGPVLVVYVFLLLVSLRLFVLTREWERSQSGNQSAVSGVQKQFALSPAAAGPQPLTARIPRGTLRNTLALVVFVLVMAGTLFSAIPRFATQNLFHTYGEQKEESNVSAFSENVEFGAFTEIQQDARVALFVQPLGDKKPTSVRMRGVALDFFDGKSWRRSGNSYTRSGPIDFQPAFTTQVYPGTYKFRVLQPPGVTRFLFGDSFPLRMQVPRPFLYQLDRMAQTVSLVDMPPKEFQYEVESMHEDLSLRQDPALLSQPARPPIHLLPQVRNRMAMPTDEEDDEDLTAEIARFFIAMRRSAQQGEATGSLQTEEPEGEASAEQDSTEANSIRSADFPHRHRGDYQSQPLTGRDVLNRYLRRCLEVPENLRKGRVADLAARWTEDQSTTFSRAMEVERRLRTEYGYSLVPKARGNYIDSFLFDVREGHCEYFATSMAVLLRNLGIPARVVNGYYSSEWNALSGNFTVRQKDAHSWIEAWMGDQYGWMTFDPTPPGGVARRDKQSALIAGLSRISDALRMRWYRYIIDYSFSDQAQILHSLAQWRQSMMVSLKKMNIFGITSDDATTVELGELTADIDWRPVAVSGFIISLLVLWQILRWMSRRRRNRLASVPYYHQIMTILIRKGMIRRPGETPREFALRVAEVRPEWADFISVTDLYYRSRYAALAPSDDEMKAVARLKGLLRQKPVTSPIQPREL